MRVEAVRFARGVLGASGALLQPDVRCRRVLRIRPAHCCKVVACCQWTSGTQNPARLFVLGLPPLDAVGTIALGLVDVNTLLLRQFIQPTR